MHPYQVQHISLGLRSLVRPPTGPYLGSEPFLTVAQKIPNFG